MTTVDSLRNSLIDTLLTIKDIDYLTALHKLLQSRSVNKGKITFTSGQTIMLKMSDEDVATENVVSQTDLDKRDLEWMNEI